MPFTTLDLSKQSGTSLPSSIVTASGLSTGKVAQVENAQSTYFVTNSTSFVDIGLTASITPSATSSKVLVLVNLTGGLKVNVNTSLKARLLRDSSEILMIETIGGYTGTTDECGFGGTSSSYLDSPSSTSSLTYKIQICTADSGNVTFGTWQSGSERAKPTITLMEILA